jgi:pyruvate/2-oxoglutarate dehydrogenase complex dihydrolipoamide acyltransferase (E2) component
VDQEEIVKRVEAILLEEKKEREARDAAREAAMKAAADDASAKAERAASDAKIAEEAAAKAREEVKKEAEAKAASDAAKAQAEAEAKAERAASDAKIAEEAAAKAKKEMEEAAAAAVPPPPEKKAPIKFKDAIGRKFNFPFHLCTKWSVSVIPSRAAGGSLLTFYRGWKSLYGRLFYMWRTLGHMSKMVIMTCSALTAKSFCPRYGIPLSSQTGPSQCTCGRCQRRPKHHHLMGAYSTWVIWSI